MARGVDAPSKESGFASSKVSQGQDKVADFGFASETTGVVSD